MPSDLQQALDQYFGKVIESEDRIFEAGKLRFQTAAWVSHLTQHHPVGQSVGILADNCFEWLALDLACARLNFPLVPLPPFFTDEQLQHLICEAEVTSLITDHGQRAQRLGFQLAPQNLDAPMLMLSKIQFHETIPTHIHKITFTSGTTGQPKGVCLTQAQQLSVAEGLKVATAKLEIKRHLCLLPFSVLLENIAGIYAPLLAGASIICPPLEEIGLNGAASFDAQKCLDAISRYKAESIVVLPQMLMALMQSSTPGDARLKTLKFIAVGGGKVPIALLTLAKWFNLPVFEGYGLSECSSVICLNTPEQHRIGTVGKPIKGIEIKIESDQEIWVKGRSFSGYLHDLKSSSPSTVPHVDWIPTGDLGTLDKDGFLTIHGRKKNLIITGFGRNISPEWPESMLLSSGLFLQVAVFGEGQKNLTAILVLREASTPTSRVVSELQKINQQLPDYAQIGRHLVVTEPFSHINGFCTPNGRLRRDAIWEAYSNQFNGETA